MAFPKDALALKKLARLIGKAGDDQQAVTLLLRVTTLEPRDQSALLNLGIAFARLGEYAEARRAWTQLLTLNPRHQDASLLLQQLPR